jgi:diaminohydroxyphosphoribosylaminopyrimidine deaminase/5-amino-6-(5-phosphoribosylamino)uracil reductase
LRAAGIRVEHGLEQTAGEELNLGFFSRMRRRRPWLRLKLAASLDGRTALANGESRWITSAEARADVQRFRAESAAILSTSATVLADDPELTARDGEVSRQPLRVILDAHARIPRSARIFSAPGRTVCLTREQIGLDAAGRLPLPAVLAWMGGAELNEVWTEAGPTLAGALLADGLVDELVLYLAPRLLGPTARPLAAWPNLERLADAPSWQVRDLRQIGPDIRIMLRRHEAA